ncbi:type III-A CRISPR-associated RAMP protein Csm4 [Thermococcus cleftensis]|nr:type III-A CRISPR-associated RAMP protein Csm4 [Thermococcus cleftensis]
MRMIAVRLRFRGPLHVGLHSLDSAGVVVHSDTLFGAIGSVLPRLGISTYEFVEAMRNARISSLFPFDSEHYYLPKPVNANSLVLGTFADTPEGYALSKRFRKAPLLTKEAFEMVVGGRIEAERLGELLPEGLPARIVDIPKVALDRLASNSNIFYMTQVHFREDAGLYFLYEGSEEIFRRYILPAVKFLGDEGLGGKRSWGLGLFDFEIDRNFSFSGLPEKSERYVTLSLVLPKSREEVLQWEPVRRSGWVHTTGGTPRRKPTMLFAAEGSIVRENAGRILDLDEIGEFSKEIGHRVHVYGRAFPVPMGG